jgi:hypothetical protein
VKRGVATGLVVALAPAGCFGGEKATSEPQQTTTSDASTVALVSPPTTPTERVLQAIRKCEVKSILFAHGNLTFVTYRDGTKARSKRLDEKTLSDAAALCPPRGRLPHHHRHRVTPPPPFASVRLPPKPVVIASAVHRTARLDPQSR